MSSVDMVLKSIKYYFLIFLNYVILKMFIHQQSIQALNSV